jgi:DnaK suppressor protein
MNAPRADEKGWTGTCQRSTACQALGADGTRWRHGSIDSAIARSKESEWQRGSEVEALKKRDMMRFKKVLEQQRDELLDNTKKTLSGDIHLDPDDFPDEIDTASSEMNLAFQGRLRERERGLLAKITQALEKIEDGIYGECESCGEAIGLKRIQARPVAELCIDCKGEQEQLERREG